MPERWIIDADGPAPLVLPTTCQNGGARVVEQRTPPPPGAIQWAARAEGQAAASRRVENREVTLKLTLERPHDDWAAWTHDFGTPPAEAEGDGDLPGWTGTVRRASEDGNPLPPMISDITAAIAALHAAGGTLTRVLDDGERITFDVLDAGDGGPTWDIDYYLAAETDLELTFTCSPYARGTERLVAQGTKAAGDRLLVLDDVDVPGDVPALARIELSGAATRQRTALFSIDQPDDATAAVGVELDASALDRPGQTVLQTQAGSLAPQVVVRPAGATLKLPAGSWQPCAYLRQGGAPLPMAGTYRVLARMVVLAPVLYRLRWSAGASEGGYSVGRTLTPKTPPFDTWPNIPWQLLDFGTVTVPDAAGLDGVIERAYDAASNAFPTAVDQIYLLPAANSAMAFASTAEPTLEVLRADVLNGSGAAPLAGSSDSTGATWTNAYPGTGAELARGGNFIGANIPETRRAYGVPVSARVSVIRTQAALRVGSTSGASVWAGDGPGIRWATSDPAASAPTGNGTGVAIRAMIDRSPTNGQVVRLWIDVSPGDGTRPGALCGQLAVGTQELFDLELDVGGEDVVARLYARDAATPLLSGRLAGAGQLRPAAGTATGLAVYAPAGAQTISFSQFLARGPETDADAVLFPGRTTTIASDGRRRRAPSGDGPIAAFEGDLPYLPPSGPADRRARVTIGLSRTDLRAGIDTPTADPFAVSVHATPRWVQLPDAAAAPLTSLLPSNDVLPDDDLLPE